jgi:hypothetical protein
MKIRDYKELIVWQRGMDLAKEMYRISQKLPDSENLI